ncbi:long-chain-fatty-acid--CoA ligase 3-like [Penaeus monodon]|uniref:long-chain-fatty-acid--CoA ligase 3-like n=1 Tax=Penaeus monodon TaxID=6687 RepID=UPI0018A7AD3F|nr:long-chain-fatty-acid--CoA ligase 3-like [Penaeus monodon]
MYTSGSMSLPKGTELTHASIVSAIISYAYAADVREDDRFLAFLPLAHVMEFCTEIALVALNNVIMYGSPKTLTNNSPKIMPGTLGDAQVAKPTYINAVPLVLDRIVDGVMERVKEKSNFMQNIFAKALAKKESQETSAFVKKLIDLMVFRQAIPGEKFSWVDLNVVNGYFLRPEKTKEAFFEMDGVRWFKTGDIAEIDDTGAIRIIDRIGDIIKLDNGEYIALGKIEMYLKEHPVIENLFVNAKAGARGCVCIAVPNEQQIKKIARALKLDASRSYRSLCRHPEVVANVLDALQKFGKEKGLRKCDIPLALYLSHIPWVPSCGLVGPAFKLRRKALEFHFQDVLKRM